MGFVALGLIGSLALLLTSIAAYAIVQNQKRKNAKASFRLIPNCLLSRHPILLLAGEESPFYRNNFFNFIPNALREHGYEVLEFHPVGRGDKRRKDIQSFIDLLRDEDLGCHWLCLPEDLPELEKLRELYPKTFKSLQALESREPQRFNLNIFLHNLINSSKIHPFIVGAPSYGQELSILKFYLQKLNSLAEQDYQQQEEHHDQLFAESQRP